MGKILKQTLAIIMVAMMVLTSIPLSGFLSLKVDAIEDSITNYNKGEIIEFGTYPQKKVSDETTINNLNALTQDANGDVEYKSNLYRNKGGIWYKYEPIKWRVVKSEKKEVILFAENIIDSKPFHPEIRGAQWLKSFLFGWLNSTFKEQALGDISGIESNYDVAITVPSREFLNSADNGFQSNADRKTTATNYAASDYAYYYWTCDPWWAYIGYAYVVGTDSGKFTSTFFQDQTNGVRPMITITKKIIKSTGTANNNKKSSFTITTKQNDYNEKFFELTDVKCFIGDKEISPIESKFEILRSELNDDITLKKEGFRDYIIPYKVAKTFSGGYNLDVYMSLSEPDGKPYISSVFARNSSETQYQDLLKTPMVAENYNTYDIVVTGVGLSSNALYYIGQDFSNKLPSDKIGNGTFSDLNLYANLTHNKTVYAFAYDKGVLTDFETLSLSKSSDDGALNRILETSTYSLGGTGGVTIKIPDENPIFGNSEISLKAFSAPITVYYDATNGTYIATIGFDLYSYTKEDKTVSQNGWSYTKFGDGETKRAFQNFKESFSYFNKKPFAENEKDKNGKSYKEQWTSFVNRCRTASKFTQKYSDKNFTHDFLGYLEFNITEQGFTIKEASIKIGFDFSYSYTYQGAVWVIPAYFKATLGASSSIEGKGKRAMLDSDLPFEYEITLDIEPRLALEAGIGVEKLAKAGVEAKGTAPLKVEFFDKHITFKFHGEINIKTKAFIFTWDKKLCEGEIDILDKYWGKTKTFALRQTAGVPQYAVLVDDNEVEDLTDYYNESTSIADRGYAENTSEWLDNGVMLLASEDSEVTVKQLQTSVLEEGKPVAVAFGDKVLMAWIEDCADRDTYNRMRLMYSVYDGISWSEPKSVYDDGKNDDAPVLATDGTDVYFAWQKINAVLDENSVVTDALQQVDICTARYDSANETINDAKIICSDNGYDYAQNITIDKGKPVIYFASCTDPSVAISYNNKINRYENNTINTLVSSLSFVHSITADGNDMSFVIDTDGDLSTSDDINAFSYSSGYNTEYEKKDISTAIIGTYYGHVNDEKVMFVTDGANIYYDLNGERKAVFANSQNISSLNLVEENGNPAFLWTEDIEAGNQICYVCYDGNSWSKPVVLTKTENYYFDSLNMVNYNQNLIGVFMQDELKYNSNSESYDISQVNLAYITIEDYMDLKVGSIFVEEETIIPGNTTELCVYVENLGTEAINNVEFTVSDSISDVQTTEVNLKLAPGENKNIYIDYIVPENFKQTTLSISAEITDETDVDTTNNSLSEPIGLPDIRITKTECVLDGNYYVITAFINNNSVTAASNINAKLWIDEEDGSIYHEAKIVSLSNDECGYVQFYVEESSLIFDETNTAKLYLVAESEGSKYGKTATECILITKSENECGHPLTETVVGNAPTCTENGTSDYEVCLICGENATESEVVLARHSFGEWYTVIPATCENIGIKQRDCSECDYSETQDIPATGHDFDGSSCKNCNLDKADSCDCRCHNDGFFAKIIWNITNFFNKLLKRNQKCNCGVIHYGTVDTNTEHIHNYNIQSTSNPTCENTGLKTYVCSCGESYDEIIEALGHDEVPFGGAPATCTNEGLSQGIKCQRCDKILVNEEIIPATHTMSIDESSSILATCTSDGLSVMICDACGYSESAVIVSTGHNYDNGICTSCGDDLTSNCSCNCHAGGLKGLIFKIILFFQKFFRLNRICEGCGVRHY